MLLSEKLIALSKKIISFALGNICRGSRLAEISSFPIVIAIVGRLDLSVTPGEYPFFEGKPNCSHFKTCSVSVLNIETI
jgi:hypothetical protein